jgi:hypothetical protein
MVRNVIVRKHSEKAPFNIYERLAKILYKSQMKKKIKEMERQREESKIKVS